MKTNFKLFRNGTLLIGALMISTFASAQWSISANLGYLFNGYSESPQIMFKKDLNGGNSAFRFSIGGNQNKSSDMLRFYKERKYENLSDWPRDIEDEKSYQSSYSSIIFAPGFELRANAGEKSVLYYGIDLNLSRQSSNSIQVNYNTSYNGVTEMYTINRVYQYTYDNSTTSVMPELFLGFGHNITSNFKIQVEASIMGGISQGTSSNTTERWDWDGSDFQDFYEDADEYEDVSEPWDPRIDWLPGFDFWFTYTFGNND